MLRKFGIIGGLAIGCFWCSPPSEADIFDNPFKKLEEEVRRVRDKVTEEYDRFEGQAKGNLRRLGDQTATNIRHLRDDVERIDSIIKET